MYRCMFATYFKNAGISTLSTLVFENAVETDWPKEILRQVKLLRYYPF